MKSCKLRWIMAVVAFVVGYIGIMVVCRLLIGGQNILANVCGGVILALAWIGLTAYHRTISPYRR